MVKGRTNRPGSGRPPEVPGNPKKERNYRATSAGDIFIRKYMRRFEVLSRCKHSVFEKWYEENFKQAEIEILGKWKPFPEPLPVKHFQFRVRKKTKDNEGE